MATKNIDICCINIRSLSDVKLYCLGVNIVVEFDVICLTEINLPHANVKYTDLPEFQQLVTKSRS